ncbi:protein zer-1 homolog [Mizuhopecten yessoensis]|uniref:protein zer-1 homolog n=1 Tax=Mizuhopecten yessoensis TaxID=6573 RepID=UPI000B45C405|nr:protein zer-1 homolog [Mizuhopecten yessoensis]
MPLNAKLFMEEPAAMDIYMSCIQTFAKEEGLLKKMTGLMANLSEVPVLRKPLMTEELMALYCDLMDSQLDKDGVSYHATSVMATMVIDPARTWTINTPARSDVLVKIVDTVNRWDLDSKMKIKYRSLRPILELIVEYETPEAQLWATWALCNLTRSKADRYCPMLELEGGLSLLEQLIEDERVLPKAATLATMSLQQCSNYKLSLEENSSGENPVE